MIRFLFTLILLIPALWGVTLEEISSKPPCREKNFMIWQFLHQDINTTEASDAFYQIDNVNTRLLADYARKTDEAEIRYTVECLQKPASELNSTLPDDCLFLALTPSKAESLSTDQRADFADRLGDRYGSIQWLKTMNRNDHFSPDTDLQGSLRLFVISSPSYRREHFNKFIDDGVLQELSSMKEFRSFVYSVATDSRLDLLQHSLSRVWGGSFDAQTHFYLGINALKHGEQTNAMFHFTASRNKAPSPIERDKCTFWLYQASKNNAYLNELNSSLDINMYVLWAREDTNTTTENYFSSLPTIEETSFAGEDPFEWNRLYQEIASTANDDLYPLVSRFEGKNAEAIQAFILDRAYYPYIHNFTHPYDRYMENIPTDQKAMLYALMRQETQLIPGLVSRSFALGLMQIMPFNVDTISKVHPLKIETYEDMFQPKFAIAYAIEHMKHIDRTLYNPVFKAYAYNGGLGFTKRLITEEKSFLSGEYEPVMSMETVWNAESREYGKRVLANYVIYKTIFGEPVSIKAILNNLTRPSLSDSFRNEEKAPPLAPAQNG